MSEGSVPCVKMVTVAIHALQADSTPISSCLIETRRGMKRAMLEVVAAGVVSSSSDVERYLKCRYVVGFMSLYLLRVLSTDSWSCF